MPILDTSKLPVLNKRPGWYGRIFHSSTMTFGHWEFRAGATIQEHLHPQEEVWQILEGALEITIADHPVRADLGNQEPAARAASAPSSVSRPRRRQDEG
jgi:hypothetical protein